MKTENLKRYLESFGANVVKEAKGVLSSVKGNTALGNSITVQVDEEQKGVSVKWGAAWSEGDIRSYSGTAEDAMNAYIDLRRSQGRRPFIDGPHFELM